MFTSSLLSQVQCPADVEKQLCSVFCGNDACDVPQGCWNLDKAPSATNDAYEIVNRLKLLNNPSSDLLNTFCTKFYGQGPNKIIMGNVQLGDLSIFCPSHTQDLRTAINANNLFYFKIPKPFSDKSLCNLPQCTINDEYKYQLCALFSGNNNCQFKTNCPKKRYSSLENSPTNPNNAQEILNRLNSIINDFPNQDFKDQFCEELIQNDSLILPTNAVDEFYSICPQNNENYSLQGQRAINRFLSLQQEDQKKLCPFIGKSPDYENAQLCAVFKGMSNCNINSQCFPHLSDTPPLLNNISELIERYKLTGIDPSTLNTFCSRILPEESENISNEFTKIISEGESNQYYDWLKSYCPIDLYHAITFETIKAIFHGGIISFLPGELNKDQKIALENSIDLKNPPPLNEPDHSNKIISRFQAIYEKSNLAQQNYLVKTFCQEVGKTGNVLFEKLNDKNAALFLQYCPNTKIPGIDAVQPDPQCDVSEFMNLPTDLSKMDEFSKKFQKRSEEIKNHITDMVGDTGDAQAKPPIPKKDGDLQKFVNLIGQLAFQNKAMLDAYAQLPKDQTDPTSPTYQAYSDWYQNQLIDSDTPPAITAQDTAMEKYLKRQVILSMCDPTQADCNQAAIDYFKATNDIQDIEAQIMALLNKNGNEFSPAPIRQNIAATNIDGAPFSYKNQSFNINTVSNWDPNLISEENQTKFINFLTKRVQGCANNLKIISIKIQQQIFDLINKIKAGQIPPPPPDELTAYTTTASIASTNLAFNVALFAVPPPVMIASMVISIIPGPDDLMNSVMNVFGTALANEIVTDINLSKEGINNIKECKSNSKTCLKGFMKLGEAYGRLIATSLMGSTIIYQIGKECAKDSSACLHSIKDSVFNAGLKIACCFSAKKGTVCSDVDGNPIDCGLAEQIYDKFKGIGQSQINDIENAVDSIKRNPSAKNITLNTLKIGLHATQLAMISTRVAYQLSYDLIIGLCNTIAGLAGASSSLCSDKVTEYLNIAGKKMLDVATLDIYNKGLKAAWNNAKATINPEFWNGVGSNIKNNLNYFFKAENINKLTGELLEVTKLNDTINALKNVGSQAVSGAENLGHTVANILHI